MLWEVWKDVLLPACRMDFKLTFHKSHTQSLHAGLLHITISFPAAASAVDYSESLIWALTISTSRTLCANLNNCTVGTTADSRAQFRAWWGRRPADTGAPPPTHCKGSGSGPKSHRLQREAPEADGAMVLGVY